jgi:hypothetical protein
MTARTRRHDPNPECDGTPTKAPTVHHNGRVLLAPLTCRECGAHLCACEAWIGGHDCEA